MLDNGKIVDCDGFLDVVFVEGVQEWQRITLWMAIDNIWKRYIVFFGSFVASETRLPISSITSKACRSHDPVVYIAMG